MNLVNNDINIHKYSGQDPGIEYLPPSTSALFQRVVFVMNHAKADVSEADALFFQNSKYLERLTEFGTLDKS
jgi:hypothetical protein